MRGLFPLLLTSLCYCSMLRCAFSHASRTSQEETEVAPLSRIAFGSCNKHDKPQPMWATISAQKPQVWIWLGDVVYNDENVMPFIRRPVPTDVMRSKYDKQKQRTEYQQFIKQLQLKNGVIGVWDDHDYGLNDGGLWYSDREPSQQIFLDFLDEPKDSPRRQQHGVYASYTYGPLDKQVKVILLDNRYSQQPPSPESDILGEEQWMWLELQLTTPISTSTSTSTSTSSSDHTQQPRLTLIGAGIQIASRNKLIGEGWKNFPKSRTRLFDLIYGNYQDYLLKYHSSSSNSAEFQSTSSSHSKLLRNRSRVYSPTVLLSGDVHMAEFTRSFYCLHNVSYFILFYFICFILFYFILFYFILFLFYFIFILFYFMLCYVMLCYVMLCYVMLCYVMLCYVMLCYVMLCYVMLCFINCIFF